MIPRSWIRCLALLAAFSASVHAAPGSADLGWGDDARVQVTLGGYSNEKARAAALQADGKIVVAASVDATGARGAVVRFNADGSPDLGFGSGGKFVLSGTPSAVAIQSDGRILVASGVSNGGGCLGIQVVRLDIFGGRDLAFNASTPGICSTFMIAHHVPASLAVQADGRIVVGGTRLGGLGTDFLLARYLPNGANDVAFGGNGVVFTDITGGEDAMAALALQPDGRILAAGAAKYGSAGDAFIAVTRYNANGTLDASFGAGGKVGTALAPSFGLTPTGLAIQADGKIVVTTSRGAVLRYEANGAPDSTFGDAGRVDGALGTGSTYTATIALLPGGRLMVAGNANNGYAAVARLLPGGNLDTTYGAGGRTDPTSAVQAAAALLAPDASMVSVGSRNTGGNDDLALIRHAANGSVDASFGNDGLAARDLALRSPTRAAAVAQQADGKILVGGTAHAGSFDTGFALARFNRDGTRDPSFGTQGSVLSSVAGLSFVPTQLRVQPDGKIVAAGGMLRGYPPQPQGVVVARYLAHGNIDTSFGGGGATVLPEQCLPASPYDALAKCRVYTALQADGRLLVAAASYGHAGARGIVVVRRLAPDGSVDSTFAGSGAAVVDFEGGESVPTGLFAGSLGRIVMVGLTRATGSAAESKLAFASLQGDGAPDPFFGTNGMVVTSQVMSEAEGLLVDNGRILVAGRGPADGFLVARFNPDGTPDTRFANLGSNLGTLGSPYYDVHVRGMARQRDGRFVVIGDAHTAPSSRDIVIARFNANGVLDKTFGVGGIVALADRGYDEAAAALVQDDGRLVVAGSKAASPQGDPFIEVVRLMAGKLPAGDFDANGTADLVLRNAADGSLAQWLMNGTAVTTQTSLGGPGTIEEAQLIGDFNGDGRADVLWHGLDGSTSMTLFSGADVLADAQLMPPGSVWRVARIGDLDGDGKDDLVWSTPLGMVRVWLMNGTSVGANIDVDLAGSTVDKLADLDGDGKADVILRDNIGGTYLAFLMNGLEVVSSATLPSPGAGWTLTHATDLDGDGRADLIWTHPSGLVQAWFMHGLVPLQVVALEAGPGLTGFTISHVADLDADGRADILWRHSDGSVIASLMGNGLVARATAQFAGSGNPWAIVQVRDFDGDGKADILWRHSGGTLAVWIMDGLAFTSAAALPGSGPWVPVP